MLTRVFVWIFIIGLTVASVNNNDINSDSQETETETPPPRKPLMPGSPTSLDLSNLEMLEKVQNVADFAVKQLDAKSNDLYHSFRIRILDASRQLVAGLKYKITFYMGQTDCPKNRVRHEEVNQNRCPISDKSEAKFTKCQVTVWEKPWQSYMGLIDDKCEQVPRQEAMQSAK